MSMEGWATTHTSNGHEHDTNVPGLEDHEHEGTCNDPCELVFLEDHEHEGTDNDPCEPRFTRTRTQNTRTLDDGP